MVFILFFRDKDNTKTMNILHLFQESVTGFNSIFNCSYCTGHQSCSCSICKPGNSLEKLLFKAGVRTLSNYDCLASYSET